MTDSSSGCSSENRTPPATRVARVRLRWWLYRTLRSTNTIENLNGSVTTYTRNVKRWRGGSMIVRWVSAAVLDASERFRKVRGYRELEALVSVLQRLETHQEDALDAQVA